MGNDKLIDEETLPHQSEPLGGLVGLLCALFEEGARAVATHRMLLGFAAVLDNRFCYVPYDIVVPGALLAGDTRDVLDAIAPTRVLIENPVDGRNCPVSLGEAERYFGYQGRDRLRHVEVRAHPQGLSTAGAWLLNALSLP